MPNSYEIKQALTAEDHDHETGRALRIQMALLKKYGVSYDQSNS